MLLGLNQTTIQQCALCGSLEQSYLSTFILCNTYKASTQYILAAVLCFMYQMQQLVNTLVVSVPTLSCHMVQMSVCHGVQMSDTFR